jgi:hypothetical protein
VTVFLRRPRPQTRSLRIRGASAQIALRPYSGSHIRPVVWFGIRDQINQTATAAYSRPVDQSSSPVGRDILGTVSLREPRLVVKDRSSEPGGSEPGACSPWSEPCQEPGSPGLVEPRDRLHCCLPHAACAPRSSGACPVGARSEPRSLHREPGEPGA